MSEFTVACVLRSGGLYNPRWVVRLQRNVARFAPVHRFVCLSDVPIDGIETIALKHNWPTWWPILEAFRPGLFSGRVVYFDLANLAVWALDPFFAGSGFVIAPDPYVVGPGRFASGVMAWDAGDTEIYDRFVPVARQVIKRLHGDQEWIMELRPDAATFNPRLAVSYKGHCRYGRFPRGTRMILCHGWPKPLEIEDRWFRKRWDVDWR